MRERKAITIVGGGLAGLTLGIALRQRDVPVTIWEAGKLPRHRVCGEFINGYGQRTLAHLGLLERIQQQGVKFARTARFFSTSGTTAPLQLSKPGICCSRFELDWWLSQEFVRLGGHWREKERWREPMNGEGVVRATGRQSHRDLNGWRWFGLKAHVTNLKLTADLEMHFLPDAYVGLCEIAAGVVNVCGLFRSRRTLPDLTVRWREYLCGPTGSILHERLAPGEFLAESFSSVAALGFKPDYRRTEDCAIGDAFSAIAPLTGNGMSMAIESAGLACDPLCDFSRGAIEWRQTSDAIHRQSIRAFARRLWVSWILQEVLFRPTLRNCLGALVTRNSGLFEFLFRHTRS